jgi:hypothetical protein
MEIDFGDLDMNHGSLQWLISSMGRPLDLHMGPNQPIFCGRLPKALLIMMVELVCPFAILGGSGDVSSWSPKLVFLSFCTYIQIEDMYMWNQFI